MRILLAISAVLALSLTGCGSDQPSGGVASAGGPPAASTSASSASASGDGRKLAQCMREHGVDMPDPDPNGVPGNTKIDRDSPAFKQAIEACKQFMPYGGDLSKVDPKLVDQLREFTKCLRENGLDVPDPDPNSATFGLEGMANLDQNNPTVKKAFEACQSKLPGRPGQ
jgi:hypothetical protein